MTRLLTLLLAGAALLGSAGLAHADQIINGGSANAVPTDVTGHQIATTHAGGTFNLFDTNLGTLTSVSFTTSYGFTSTIMVTAGATGSQGDVYTESAMKFLSDSNAITSVLNGDVNIATGSRRTNTAFIGGKQLTPIAYDVLGSDNTFNLGPNVTATFTSSSPDTGMSFPADTNSSDLAAFSAAGGGTFNVNFSTLTGTVTTTSSGNVAASQSTTADAGFGIYYNYTPTPPATVPEPASMAILGAGLLGAGLVRRRSRK